IPAACIDATIVTEDEHFYTNPGVDARGVARAFWINLRGGDVLAGGSTITQQVVRNLLIGEEERAGRTLRRKLREVILAYRLTRTSSKDDILALYLNQTYYGNLAYGIDAASRSIFNKPVSALGLAECALLAGLPQAPSLYDPLTDPLAASARQAVVIGLLETKGIISAEQAQAARVEPLAFAGERYTIEAPHFVSMAYDEAAEILPAEVMQRGGLTIRTTLDLDWQHTAEATITRQLERLNTPDLASPPRNANNAALAALDPHTGQVLALVGSANYNDPAISGAINMALSSRQPGSALKPFTYALALDPTRPGPWTAGTMILDVRTAFVTREGFSYVPVNYDLQEHGPVLVRQALASSYTVPAVVALDHVGLPRLLDLLARLGITTLRDADALGLSLTLGGGDIRLLELTAAYAALANGGTMIHPQIILDIAGEDGAVLYHRESGRGGQEIDPRVAWLITDILSDNTARAPAFSTHSILQIGRPAAVKTGTTTDYRDNWTVGYTPDLVVGVWVGNADNAPMVNISGVSGAGPIWHDFMRLVLRGTPERAFMQPAGLEQAEICALSGMLPSPACPQTRYEWFIQGTAPTEPDTIFHIAGGRLVLDLPPQAHAWARSQNLPLLADLPDVAGGTASGLRLLAPDDATVYRMASTLPASAQRIRFEAAGPADLRVVSFVLNGTTLGTVSAPPYSTWWALAPGEYSLYAAGILSSGQTVRTPGVSFRVEPPG
ncbi:MAG: transglycosylase domain-containing protein, partial [Anaerolineae bacterium]|nr:transglycosylase domain-containing protein [Anaerolineae bacterium]